MDEVGRLGTTGTGQGFGGKAFARKKDPLHKKAKRKPKTRRTTIAAQADAGPNVAIVQTSGTCRLFLRLSRFWLIHSLLCRQKNDVHSENSSEVGKYLLLKGLSLRPQLFIETATKPSIPGRWQSLPIPRQISTEFSLERNKSRIALTHSGQRSSGEQGSIRRFSLSLEVRSGWVRKRKSVVGVALRGFQFDICPSNVCTTCRVTHDTHTTAGRIVVESCMNFRCGSLII